MRVLLFIHGLNIGGAETFLNNMLSEAPGNIEFHFAIQNPTITNTSLSEYINIVGEDRLHILPAFTNSPFRHYITLKRLIRLLNFQWIHVHMNAMINPIPLIVAKQLNVPVIIHSHSTSSLAGGFGVFVHKINRMLFSYKDQKRVACSELAGKWMFGNRPFVIMNNAIPLDKYKFSQNDRVDVRNKLHISESTLVLGAIGRFVGAKNHKFMVDIFKRFNQIFPDSKLLLVGDGPLREDVGKYALENGVISDVVFTGSQPRPMAFFSAMDVFLLPSFFEGLGFTAVESQASGLPVIASDNVPHEVKVSDSVFFMSLKQTAEAWADLAKELIFKYKDMNRLAMGGQLINSRFDSKTLRKAILELYH